VADWLEHREPGDLLDEVRRFARRRPGTFLVGAAVAGALVGRLTRGVVAQQQEKSGDGQATAPPPHTGPAGTPPLPQPGGPAVPPPSAPQPGEPGYPATAPAGPGGYTAPQPPDALPPAGARFSAPGQVP
jgi:hypothetical protein